MVCPSFFPEIGKRLGLFSVKNFHIFLNYQSLNKKNLEKSPLSPIYTSPCKKRGAENDLSIFFEILFLNHLFAN